MKSLRVVTLHVLVVFTCLLCRTSWGDVRPEEEVDVNAQGVLLKHAVKSMLGFKDLPLGSPNDIAPQYMLELYEKYKSGRIQSGRVVANTVRSIHAEIGVVRDTAMFIFNLSSVAEDEDIISGELHVLTKLNAPHTQRNRNRTASGNAVEEQEEGEEEKDEGEEEIVSQLFRLSPSSISEVGVKSIPSKARRGWRSVSITAAVKACTRDSKHAHRELLAMYFGHRQSSGKVSSLPMSRVMQMFARPFLVVYSNASQNISVDHVSPHFGAAAAAARRQTYVDPATGHTQSFRTESRAGRRKHRRRQHGRKSDDIFRVRRSIFDNELPNNEFPMDPVDSNVPRTNPTVLQGRARVAPTDGAEGRYLPYPDDYKQAKRRRRRRKQRKGKKGRKQRDRDKSSRLLPDYWESKYNSIDAIVPPVPAQETCGVRHLLVDFADIGWNEWIISPPSFQANYCAGTCSFPLSQGVRPSNHATIQSILQAIGIHPEVPSPCCVPDVVSSLTLLYIDENSNVVLKNYPSMTVETCACR